MHKIHNYKIMGVRADDSKELLAEGYPSRGWCFASATKLAIDLSIDMPGQYSRLEIINENDEPLSEYNNSNMLLVAG